ncbi:uncharacterized protein LOC141913879 isoform X3 [Tubulanus polymorphus]|uniref:uncharacterized protein LOC141913879 isoform X3 n=1 Tax=Tubulanus polymorphus TaxID=672921 RepID=UPI003DA1DCB5
METSNTCSCIVHNCTNHRRSNESIHLSPISFHIIPKPRDCNKPLLAVIRKWIEIIAHPRLTLKTLSHGSEMFYICSDHFQEKDFTGTRQRILKDIAVPSIFPPGHPSHDPTLYLSFRKRMKPRSPIQDRGGLPSPGGPMPGGPLPGGPPPIKRMRKNNNDHRQTADINVNHSVVRNKTLNRGVEPIIIDEDDDDEETSPRQPLKSPIHAQRSPLQTLKRKTPTVVPPPPTAAPPKSSGNQVLSPTIKPLNQSLKPTAVVTIIDDDDDDKDVIVTMETRSPKVSTKTNQCARRPDQQTPAPPSEQPVNGAHLKTVRKPLTVAPPMIPARVVTPSSFKTNPIAKTLSPGNRGTEKITDIPEDQPDDVVIIDSPSNKSLNISPKSISDSSLTVKDTQRNENGSEIETITRPQAKRGRPPKSKMKIRLITKTGTYSVEHTGPTTGTPSVERTTGTSSLERTVPLTRTSSVERTTGTSSLERTVPLTRTSSVERTVPLTRTSSLERTVMGTSGGEIHTVPGTSGLGIKLTSLNAGSDESNSKTMKALLTLLEKKEEPEVEVLGSVPGRWVPLDEYYYGKQEGLIESQEIGEYRFKCYHCQIMLYNNIKVMIHMRAHIESEKQQNIDLNDLTQCKHCFRQFDTPFEMQTHVEKVHQSNSCVLVCRICEKDHTTHRTLTAHMRTVHKPCEMPYVCQLCSFRSSLYDDIIDHFNKKHDKTRHVLCFYCLKVFKVSLSSRHGWGLTQSFYQHLQRHQTHSTCRKCTACKLVFVTKNDLKFHKSTHHATNRRTDTGRNCISNTGKTTSNEQVMIQLGGGKGRVGTSHIKSLNVPQHSKVQEMSSVKIVEPVSHLRCVECTKVMSSRGHYKKYIQCSLCRFATCCSNSYSSHMLKYHAGYGTLDIPLEHPQPEFMFCLCGFRSRYGNTLAHHLVFCNKFSCYKTRPAPRCVEVFETVSPDMCDTANTDEVPQTIFTALGLKRKRSNEEPIADDPDHICRTIVSSIVNEVVPLEIIEIPDSDRDGAKDNAGTVSLKGVENENIRRSDDNLETHNNKPDIGTVTLKAEINDELVKLELVPNQLVDTTVDPAKIDILSNVITLKNENAELQNDTISSQIAVVVKTEVDSDLVKTNEAEIDKTMNSMEQSENISQGNDVVITDTHNDQISIPTGHNQIETESNVNLIKVEGTCDDLASTYEANDNKVDTVDVKEERPDTDEVNEERPDTDEVNEERPDTDEVNEERPDTDEVNEERPDTDEVNEERPDTDEVNEERPDTDEVNEERPDTDEVNEERPDTDEVNEERPDTDEVNEERPDTDEVNEERPDTDEVNEERPDTDEVNEERPDTDEVNEERPDTDEVNEERPDTDEVNEERPDTDEVNEERPDTDEVNEERPDTDEVKEERPEMDDVIEDETGVETNEQVVDSGATNDTDVEMVEAKEQDTDCSEAMEVDICKDVSNPEILAVNGLQHEPKNGQLIVNKNNLINEKVKTGSLNLGCNSDNN